MKKIILILILILGTVLRIWGVGSSPPGFNADEASLGYNAYSLLKTGKDEWGERIPLVFKSFSDYKPGIYVYLAIPFITLLGLTELAVRLPSIILGILSILLIYLLSQEIFKNKIIDLASAFLLAISPWAIHFSRGAWETNLATFFILLGMICFFWGLKNFKWFFLSVIYFTLSMYSYQSTRVIVPLLLLSLILIYRKNLVKKQIIFPAIFSVFLLIPLALIIFSGKGYARFQGVSIFADSGPVNRINRERGEHPEANSWSSKLHHNKPIIYSNAFLKNYLDHFTPQFLFLSGDPIKRNKIPELGQLHFFEIVTVIIGLISFLTKNFVHKKAIFVWLLVSPIAAALTFQTPHALRSHNMVIPLTLISGLGLGVLIERIWNLKGYLKLSLTSILVVIMLYFGAKFSHQYLVHLPKQYALEWEYGFSKLVPLVLEKQSQYQKVVITTRYDQPYILLLFYSRYDPLKYQTSPKTEGDNQFGFSTVTSFDKYEFKRLSKDEINQSKNTLFVGTEEELENAGRMIDTINFPNGKVAFKLVET